jgi:hypothetical protein
MKGICSSEHPISMPKLPFWSFRASSILPERLMDAVLDTMADAVAA